MRKAVIVGGTRIPFVKSFTKYSKKSNHDMMSHVLRHLVEKFNLRGKTVDEVSLGAVIKHSRDWNLARECVLSSGLDPHTPAYDVQQACGTSLQTAINISNKIKLGQIEVGIAAGTDTNSDLPVVFKDSMAKKLMAMNAARSAGQKIQKALEIRPADFAPTFPTASEPRTGKSMGQHAELMAKEWGVTRQEQDELAYASQKNAIQAYETGFYNDLVIEFEGVQRDAFIRPDSSIEGLAKLKPAFDKENGTLTAGNSTPLTDGASAVLICSEEYAQKMGWPIQAYFVDGQHAACDFVGGEGLLMAPPYAVPKMLARHNMKLQDFDIYEIHEAFAAQVLSTLKAWEDEKYCKEMLGLDVPMGSIDRAKMNLKGGSVAIGHPFAATGARIVAGLAKQLEGNPGQKGLISVCTAGGMGVVAILEGAAKS